MKLRAFISKYYAVTAGAAALVLGLFLVIFPALAVKLFGYLVGGVLLAAGIGGLLYSIRNDRPATAASCLLILFGLLACLWASLLTVLLFNGIGVLLLVLSIRRLSRAVTRWQGRDKYCIVELVHALLGTAVALFLLLSPASARDLAVTVLGIGLILWGAEACVTFFGVKKPSRHAASHPDGRIYVDHEKLD